MKTFRNIAWWVPLGFVTLCVLAQAMALPYLDDLIVSQWSFDGEPVTWRPAWEGLVVTGSIGIGTIVLGYPGGLVSAKRQAHRGFAAVTWLILMLSLPILTVIVVGQVWTTDLHLGRAFLASLVAATTCAVSAALLTPRFPEAASEPDPEQWSRATLADRLVQGRTFKVALHAMVGFMAVIASIAGTVWWAICIVLVWNTLFMLSRVTIAKINASGVTVRSSLGAPRVTIKLSEIESAEIVDFDAQPDIGRVGGKTRTGSSRQGVVIRRGEGLRIRRHSGVDFLLATDDAAGAAHTLGAQLAAERAA